MVDPRRQAELNLALQLLSSAFRRVVERPDPLLVEEKVTRVQHRILACVAGNAELTVTELLVELEVTKQALHKPLKDLVERRLLESFAPEENRRQKRLRLTAKGRTLEERLSEPQRERLAKAFKKAGGLDAEEAWLRVMRRLSRRKSDAT